MELILLTFLFIVLATLQLSIFFGIAWEFNAWVDTRLKRWKQRPNMYRPFYLGFFLAAKLLALAFIIDDWLTNLIPVSLYFAIVSGFKRGLPNSDCRILGVRLPWLQLVTGRIQSYIDQLGVDRNAFNRAEKGYIKFVVRMAQKFDETHFDVPAGVLP